ncbi:PEP-CTERM/exosortase system-associated acyltransferase [Aliiglaciecola sp. LCG003]|uniref:PEP-CTERM/exosortase system-associated acyltransferase n=1 Tax=Aliiglaciecola sp. LCG003 TaxID=3053655 RepID=UPI002573ECE7|nr:PEP-CTERM/exosortase system-associated acyltransferase [Aliiglaciecola sp. LCG003]WJG08641.1 PEP-CTERM/exosortase system-associated acyltransferase [Aliiglaciecola sp. LCG003]
MSKKQRSISSIKNSRLIKPVVRRAHAYSINKKALSISEQFSNSFRPVIANSELLRQQTYQMRHDVYAKEMGFEPIQSNGLEIDEFDGYSTHCALIHQHTSQVAGSVRIVRPTQEGQLLPMQKFVHQNFSASALHPADLRLEKMCEISRLTVPLKFRRREIDHHSGAEMGVINQMTYSESEIRCFPFISVGLYLTVAAVVLREGINHCYIMVEPRLVKSMQFVGLPFEQIGPVIDYNGMRAPYYLRTQLIPTHLKEGFRLLLSNIDAHLEYA